MASNEQSEKNLPESKIRTTPSDVASGSSSAHQDGPSNDQDRADFLVLNPLTVHLLGDHVETIRRTMLEQDAEFREQVRELHRVFNVQKELAQELRRNEQYKNTLPLNVGSSSLVSQISSDAEGINYTPLNFLNEMGSGIAPNEGQSSQSKNLNIMKKVLDLGLPADAYIGNHSDEKTQSDEKDLKLSADHVNKDFGLQSDSQLENIQSKPILIDLNEPVEDNSIIEEVRNPNLINFIDGMNLNDAIREHSGNQTTPGSDFLSQRRGRGRDADRPPAPSVQSMMGFDNYVPDNKRGKSWFGENRLYGSEVFGRGRPLANSSYPGTMGPQIGSSYSAPFAAAFGNSVNDKNRFPALSPSCTFTGFPKANLETGSLNPVTDNLRKRELKPHLNSEANSSFHLQNGMWPSCIYTAPHINLNNIGDNSATDNDVQPRHKGKTIGDIVWRHEEEASRNASWPRLMSAFIESEEEKYSMGYPPMIANGGGKVAPKFQVKQGRETSCSMSLLQHSASEAWHKKLQLVDMPDVFKTRNVVGFPSGFHERQNLPFNTFSKPKLGDICYSTGLSSIIKEHGLKRRMNDTASGSGSGKNPKFYRNQFHPNSGLNLGVSESSDVPPVNNVMNSSALPVRAPITHQREVNCDPWSMSTKLDHSAKLVRMPTSKIARAQEKEHQCFQTKLIRVAAMDIVILSSNAHDCLKDNASHPVTDHSCQTLSWFADIVSSIAKDGGLPTEDDVPDSFECMTLKLEEIKEEEYRKWSGPIEVEVPREEKTNGVERLLTKAGRGQGKKRRQPRDFQKEVLPSLASLTRNEVTEDFQVLGALMRTAGMPLPMGISRRSRFGKGRGRPPRNAAAEEVEIPDSPPRMPPPSKTNVLAGSGWGIRQQRRPKKN
ncbi:hypothetical protein J5N97_010304 [Dioscorea zingiberensis]|uniref:Uncharacterized protein n=1 Tax=Dioscorea zingiberensis TaxID=325984 RepID=A0A9D5CZU5_9LILI|nr:hypothetical protein J5N97_010304 [Dioscorea zingiberensis]